MNEAERAIEALRVTYENNCGRIRHGERPLGIHTCFVCNGEFRINEAKFCDVCQWWISPCNHCGCSLSLPARVALAKAFFSICGGVCQLNPKRKKRRSSNIIRGVTREDFIKFVEKIYPNLAVDYHAGRLGFEKLILEVEARSGLVWVFKA